MNPSELRFVEGGDRGKLLEYARRKGGERSFTLGEVCKEAGLTPSRELMVLADQLCSEGLLRRCGPAQFKYLPPPPAPEQPLVIAEPVIGAKLPASPPTGLTAQLAALGGAQVKRRTPLPSAPPQLSGTAPAQTSAVRNARATPSARRPVGPKRPAPPSLSVADQIRALPIDDRPARPRKEKPVPKVDKSTAVERAKALQAEQKLLVRDLVAELADTEARAAEIRELLSSMGAAAEDRAVPAARPRARVDRAAKAPKRGRKGDKATRLEQATEFVVGAYSEGSRFGNAEISAHLRISADHANVLLRQLVDAGAIRRVKRGAYVLAKKAA